MKNKMSDLRNHLFETLEALKDEDKPMDLARAKAISEVAQTLIDSAKVEVEMVKVMDGTVGVGEFFDGTQELLDGRDSKPRLIARRSGL